MYWGQISVAIAAALGATYYLSEHGFAVVTAVLLGVCIYVGIRWVIAWVYRVQYWYNRGTRGIYTETCPNCNATRHRRGGDWLLRCHRCGWTTGLPGVRWFTKSVPAIQLRRTIVGPKLLVVIIALGLVVSGATAGVGVGELTENFTGTSKVDDGVQTPTRQWEHGYNRTQVQQHFINLLNQERRERGLGTVEAWDVLREMGRAHSQNMAVHDYIGHDEPEDGSIKQRFRAKGLLPECRIPIQGTDQYYPGAENAAKTWIDRDVAASWTSGGTYRVTTERELAWALFQIWMHSKPHRKAMLTEDVNRVGLGIDITNQGGVYASLEMCS